MKAEFTALEIPYKGELSNQVQKIKNLSGKS